MHNGREQGDFIGAEPIWYEKDLTVLLKQVCDYHKSRVSCQKGPICHA